MDKRHSFLLYHSSHASLLSFRFIYPNGKEMKDFALNNDEIRIKRNAYSMCTMIDVLNDIATHYKKHHCKDANYEKSFVFIEKDAFENFLTGPKPPLVPFSES